MRVGDGAFDVSLVATFHHEGYIAGWTLDNLARLRREADVAGLSHELICVLDKADDKTIAVVEGHDGRRRHDKVLRVLHGDLGMSRNEGVSRATGEFVATLDGDDYYSLNWLTQAHKTAMGSGAAKQVVQPSFIISFGESRNIMKVPNQQTDIVPTEALLTINPWGSSFFVRRAAIADCPYQETRAEATGFGYEDWHWNLEMLARGFTFVTAPHTARYYRRSPNSLLMRTIASRAVVRPSSFFRMRPEKGGRE